MIDIVFRSEEHAVFVDVPRFKRMGTTGIGVKRIDDLALSPRPEALRILSIRDGQIDADFRIATGM